MQCDICGGSFEDSGSAGVSSFRMRTAVRRGFDPFKVPGIEAVHARRIASVMKLDAHTMVQYWRELVRAHPDTIGSAQRPDASPDILSAMTQQAMVDRFAK